MSDVEAPLFEVVAEDVPLAALLAEHGVDRVVNVPAGLRSKAELLETLAVLLQFPDWYGANWDALSDMLRDLSWLEDDQLLLRHEDFPLEEDERRTYLSVLRDAVRTWRSREEPRLVVSFPQSIVEGPGDEG